MLSSGPGLCRVDVGLPHSAVVIVTSHVNGDTLRACGNAEGVCTMVLPELAALLR